ncbi:MAG TPA: polysaccharide deacetylase family protein [Chthoniobacterales bacterium]|nr:polysaccharide deacetylase family protein [Chthoniobacterales bacterium]
MRNLVVSVHDVSPLTQASCARILDDLREAGVAMTSLLIIPNHHQRAPVKEYEEFREWLKSKVDEGHEPILHGYFHARNPKSTDAGIVKFTNQIYTAGEGEFYDLDRSEASRRLRQGLDDLRFLQRPISGFVAPAWLLGFEAEAAVRQVGFRYITTVGSVDVFDGLHRYVSRSLVWSTRSSWRRVVSLAWNQGLNSRLRQKSLLRIAIHPTDREIPMVWSQVKRVLASALEVRRPLTYEKFIANHLKTTES